VCSAISTSLLPNRPCPFLPCALAGKLALSSPEGLLASLDACVPAEARRRGTQLLQPRRLTTTPFLSGMTMSQAYTSTETAQTFIQHVEPVRGNSLRSIADGFLKRKSRRSSAGESASDRLVNPIVALQSAPGGGKSAMLDTAALLSAQSLWTEQYCPDEQMRGILNSSIPVTITYNSGTDPDFSDYDADVQTGLALRILHSFFVDPTALRFDAFTRRMPGKVPVGLAVETCLLAAERETGVKRGMLLLVDEIVKMLEKLQGAPLLPLLGRLLDTFPSEQLNLVCTTLDAVMLDKEETRSGRRIHWARLPTLSQAAAEKMFLSALRANSSATSLPPAVRITISDAAGHPRSLQYVLEAMLELGEKRGQLQRLRDAVLTRFPTSLAPSFAAVRAALRGEALLLDSTPLGDGRKLHELIAAGIFINTDATDTAGQLVPKLSMLRLLQFAQANTNNHAELPARAAARCINKLAEQEVEGAASAQGATLTGDPFERFMARWLQLMSIVRADETLTALRLFHAEELDDFVKSGPLIRSFRLDGVQWKDPLPRRFKAALNSGGIRGCDSGIICSFGDRNPAFDVLLTAPCSPSEDGAYLALAVETRISNVGSTTVDGDLAHKWQLFDDEQRPLFARLSPGPPADIVYVYAAARSVAEVAAEQKARVAEGVLVLGNSREGEAASLGTVQRALTPTLADRAFFLLNLRAS